MAANPTYPREIGLSAVTGKPRPHAASRVGISSQHATDNATGRLLHRILDCDVVTLLSLNFAAASAWFTLTDGTKRLSTHRHLVRRSLAKALATRLPQRSSTVVMWPGGLDFECPLPGCPAGPYQLVVPLHVGLDQLSAWLLGRAGRVFSEAEAEHATLLAPGLRLRVSRTEQPPQCDDLPWLTERELGVLELVSRGLTARAVARRSGISERTVQKHLEHVYEKLGCRDRLSAVMRAREAGLLPPLLLAE